MPLAVAAAGALLAVAGMSVAEYLQRLDAAADAGPSRGPPAPRLPASGSQGLEPFPRPAAGRSAAAARLLGICSVMAPDISQDLINSQAMAETLRDLDPTISERAMIARLIRQIDLLALIKVDNNNAADPGAPGRPGRRQRAHVGGGKGGGAARRPPDAGRRPPEGDVDDPQTWPRYRLSGRTSGRRRPCGHRRPRSASCSSSACATSGSATTWSAASGERRRSSVPGGACWPGTRIRNCRLGRMVTGKPDPGQRIRCGGSCSGCSSTWRTSCATWRNSRRPGRWTRRCSQGQPRTARRGAPAHPADPRQPGRRHACPRRIPGALELDLGTYESWRERIR